MLDYWDLDEWERSELTEEEINKCLDFELMRKGVIRFPHPGIEPQPPVLEKNEIWYKCCDVYFKSSEDAAKIANPFKKEHDYKIGYDIFWISSRSDLEIVVEKFPSYETIQKHRIGLIKYKEEKALWDKKNSDYYNNNKEITTACASILEDWESLNNTVQAYGNIIETYNSYCKMTDNNKKLAFDFLLKLKQYSESLIKEAFVWFEIEFPIVTNEVIDV